VSEVHDRHPANYLELQRHQANDEWVYSTPIPDFRVHNIEITYSTVTWVGPWCLMTVTFSSLLQYYIFEKDWNILPPLRWAAHRNSPEYSSVLTISAIYYLTLRSRLSHALHKFILFYLVSPILYKYAPLPHQSTKYVTVFIFEIRPGFTLVDAPVQCSGWCPKTSNYPSSKMKPTLVSTNDRLLVLSHLIFEEKSSKIFLYRTLSN